MPQSNVTLIRPVKLLHNITRFLPLAIKARCVRIEPYIRFHILSMFGLLSGSLLGNSCSLGLRYVSHVEVPNCQFCFSSLGFWSGDFCLIAPFSDHCLLVPLLYTTNTRRKKRSNFGRRTYFKSLPRCFI